MALDLLHELLDEGPDSPNAHKAEAAAELYRKAVSVCERFALPLSSIRAELWSAGGRSSRRCLHAAQNALVYTGAVWALALGWAPKGPRVPFGWVWLELDERPAALWSEKVRNKDAYKVPVYYWRYLLHRDQTEELKTYAHYTKDTRSSWYKNLYRIDYRPAKGATPEQLELF